MNKLMRAATPPKLKYVLKHSRRRRSRSPPSRSWPQSANPDRPLPSRLLKHQVHLPGRSWRHTFVPSRCRIRSKIWYWARVRKCGDPLRWHNIWSTPPCRVIGGTSRWAHHGGGTTFVFLPKKGIKLFGERAEKATRKELQAIHGMGTYKPLDASKLTGQENVIP